MRRLVRITDQRWVDYEEVAKAAGWQNSSWIYEPAVLKLQLGHIVSRGTNHNAYNRAKQRAREAGEYQRRGPGVWVWVEAKGQHAPDNERKAREAAERAKGRMDFCSICKESFRSNSPEVGIFVCPKCRSKGKPTTDVDVA